jgi:hypothetical protein
MAGASQVSSPGHPPPEPGAKPSRAAPDSPGRSADDRFSRRGTWARTPDRRDRDPLACILDHRYSRRIARAHIPDLGHNRHAARGRIRDHLAHIPDVRHSRRVARACTQDHGRSPPAVAARTPDHRARSREGRRRPVSRQPRTAAPWEVAIRAWRASAVSVEGSWCSFPIHVSERFLGNRRRSENSQTRTRGGGGGDARLWDQPYHSPEVSLGSGLGAGALSRTPSSL